AALTSAARQRLYLLGMPEGVIDEVARRGRPQTTITVRAPRGGAITMLSVRPGMTVMAGQTLAEISGYSPIWLEAAVPEALATEVRVGQPVNAALTAFPGERFDGRITAILPSAADASRTITVRAALPNPDLRLKPGMFAEVSLSPQRRRALIVPSEAVIRTGTRTLVMIAEKGGRYRPAEVRIGREASGRTEILAGLAPGEEVVTSGQFLLDSEASLAGLDVRPVDAPSEAARNGAAQDEEQPQTYSATGTVQKVSEGNVTLRHGPVPALKWPGMTMAFAVDASAELDGLEKGDRVSFTFAQEDSGPRVMSIEKAGQ
ncbi:MAG: efflux RND transporter periplasmic adaptor subunit, partial [Pacificimonas sp.]